MIAVANDDPLAKGEQDRFEPALPFLDALARRGYGIEIFAPSRDELAAKGADTFG